jgi:hypothetical protein
MLTSIRVAVQRRWDFDGHPRNLAAAVGAIAALTLAGIVAEKYQLVDQWPGSPHVVLIAVIASRLGLRSALLATAVGTPALNFFFLSSAAVAHAWGFAWPTSGELVIYLSMLAAACLVARPRPPSSGAVYDRGPNLPFTRRDGSDGGGQGGLHATGWTYWDVRPTGDWVEDVNVGAEYCRIWADRANNAEPRPLFAWVLHDMIRVGRWSGVEVGWASALEAMALKTTTAAPAAQPQQSSE